MKFLRWVLLALIALVLILFAVSNREGVSIGLWPLPDFIEMPLYLVVLGTLIVGFLFGQLVTWLGGWHWRREARRSRQRVAELERDLEAERARKSGQQERLAVLPR